MEMWQFIFGSLRFYFCVIGKRASISARTPATTHIKRTYNQIQSSIPIWTWNKKKKNEKKKKQKQLHKWTQRTKMREKKQSNVSRSNCSTWSSKWKIQRYGIYAHVFQIEDKKTTFFFSFLMLVRIRIQLIHHFYGHVQADIMI